MVLPLVKQGLPEAAPHTVQHCDGALQCGVFWQHNYHVHLELGR